MLEIKSLTQLANSLGLKQDQCDPQALATRIAFFLAAWHATHSIHTFTLHTTVSVGVGCMCCNSQVCSLEGEGLSPSRPLHFQHGCGAVWVSLHGVLLNALHWSIYSSLGLC